MLLMVFAIIMSIINLKLYYVCTSFHVGETPPPSLCSEEAKGCDFTG